MPDVHHNSQLNQLMIDLGRSLLQYVGQCSTWTSRDEAAIATEFPAIVAIQQQHASELADLLTARQWMIDYGGFPAAYTDLHFLSLKYLLKSIVINQRAVVAALDEASHDCVDDPEAAAVINRILASERQITERLEAMARPAVAA